jgi:hypothetical protein
MKTKKVHGIDVPSDWNPNLKPTLPKEPQKHVDVKKLMSISFLTPNQPYPNQQITLSDLINKLDDEITFNNVLLDWSYGNLRIFQLEQVENKKYVNEMITYNEKKKKYSDWMAIKEMVNEAKEIEKRKKKYEQYLKLKAEFEQSEQS